MRVSTSMIFEAGVSSMQRQSASLLHTQQQLASGRRMLTPSDDPVAASRALEVTQSREINAQLRINQDNARSTLGLVDGQLAAVTNLIHAVRERAVQAGNAPLGDSDRAALAADLRGRFDELLGIANATDGAGQYLFSGYQGSTRPFSGSVGAPVAYAGDEGQRALQVGASRRLPVSDAGSEVFMRIRNGNGSFATGLAATPNGGSATVDAGNVLDPAKWASPANSGDLEIRFWNDTSGASPALRYDLVDRASGTSLLTGTPSATGAGGTYLRSYSSGQAIDFSGLAAPYNDFGVAVTVSGKPADGDAFSVKSSSSQSLFDTLGRLIMAVERPQAGGASTSTTLANEVGFALRDLDQSLDNVLRVRAAVGSRMTEVDALANVSEDLHLQYEATLSRLQDVDYAQAITQLTREQTNLEAAQRSFLRVSGLSLFNFL